MDLARLPLIRCAWRRELGCLRDRSPRLESVCAVVNRLRGRHEEIARAIYSRIQEAVPGSGRSREPAYQTGVLAAVNAVLAYSLDAIVHGLGSSGSIPVEATSQARRAARMGISSSTVLRRYVAGHGRLGEFIAEETARIGSQATRLPFFT